MNQTLIERRLDAGETSERVAFTCPGCGRETVIHVGLQTMLPEKRCMQCRGSLRTGRGGTLVVKGRRIGTHEGSLKTKERRAIKAAASARNRSRRPGLRAKNGTTYREPCRSYDECNHRKHQFRKSARR